MRQMLIRQLAPIIVCLFSLAACKTSHTTKAPVKRPPPLVAKKAAGVVVVEDKTRVAGTKDVGTDQVPQFTVTVDISQCIGVNKWLDPHATGGASPGSISVVLKSEDPAIKTQPAPWLLEPSETSQPGGAVEAVHSHSWRLPEGAFQIELIAFNVLTAQQESRISTKFDFKTSRDLTLPVVGVWSATHVCDLRWQADLPATTPAGATVAPNVPASGT
jgi:hypothetical protein